MSAPTVPVPQRYSLPLKNNALVPSGLSETVYGPGRERCPLFGPALDLVRLIMVAGVFLARDGRADLGESTAASVQARQLPPRARRRPRRS
jgi:hypothetical protein